MLTDLLKNAGKRAARRVALRVGLGVFAAAAATSVLLVLLIKPRTGLDAREPRS